MQQNASAGGAVPTLGAHDLISGLLSGFPDIISEEFCNLPSAHLTLDLIWQLRQVAAALLEQDSISGLVITHGTDTLEETAYLLDLTVNTNKPIVFTGAMHTSSDVGYDGFANLAAALQVAAAEQARGLGALVVMNNEVHAARHVTKTHTQSLDTFRSLGGPLGRVDSQVEIVYRVQHRTLPTEHLETRVSLVRLSIGMDSDVLQRLMEREERGVIIEALGGGRVPPWWMPDIQAVIKQGMWVGISSRCPSGPVHDHYGYAGAYKDLAATGVLFSRELNGQKARIRLMVVLGGTNDPMLIRKRFSGTTLAP